MSKVSDAVDSSKNPGRGRRHRDLHPLVTATASFLQSEELPWPLMKARRSLESGERAWLLLGVAGREGPIGVLDAFPWAGGCSASQAMAACSLFLLQ